MSKFLQFFSNFFNINFQPAIQMNISDDNQQQNKYFFRGRAFTFSAINPPCFSTKTTTISREPSWVHGMLKLILNASSPTFVTLKKRKMKLTVLEYNLRFQLEKRKVSIHQKRKEKFLSTKNPIQFSKTFFYTLCMQYISSDSYNYQNLSGNSLNLSHCRSEPLFLHESLHEHISQSPMVKYGENDIFTGVFQNCKWNSRQKSSKT